MTNRFFSFGLFLVFLTTSLTFTVANEDKRPLEHEDYDRWNAITGTTISDDGSWAMYTLRDGKDNNTLVIRSLTSRKEYSINNATGGRMSADRKYVAYRIVPDKELIKKLKKEKKPKDELPQEKFELLNLETGAQTTMQNVNSFAMPEKNGGWIAILLKAPETESNVETKQADEMEKFEVTPEGLTRPTKKSQKKKSATKAKTKAGEEEKEKQAEGGKDKKDKSKKDKPEKEKPDGTTLILKDLSSGLELRYPHVVSYRFDQTGSNLAFATSNKTDGDQDGVFWVDLSSKKQVQVASGLGNYRNLVFDVKGKRLAFVTDRDDYESKDSSWSLYLGRKGKKQADKIAHEGDAGIPEDWWVSSTAAPYFDEYDRYLFFYTAPKPEDVNQDEDEKDDDEPKAKLDLWHWQDPMLQPQQLLQAEEERRRSYIATYNLRTRKLVQLATQDIPDVAVDPKRDSGSTLGISDIKYRKTISWDMPGFRDVYLIDVKTGKSEMMLERIRNRPQLSPDGKFAIWWDTDSRNWFVVSTKIGAEKINLTQSIEFPFWNQLHDTPSDPRAYGIAGWTANDDSVLVYDRYDIWELDPSGQAEPVCVTQSMGREQTIRFRYQRLDREARFVDRDDMFLAAFNEKNKDSGFYRYRTVKNEEGADDGDDESEEMQSPLQKSLMLPESLGGFVKAQASDRVLFTRSTFRRFPDIWASDMKFESIERISKSNPQQQEYSWGSVELTNWTADDGQELSGLLYKPDGFDEDKKYPLMVYFYERNSDNLHRYYVPAAGRSIINFSFYVSRGYVVFVPDIPYKTGEPGPSAANAVLPGVKHVVDMGFIDEKRIGTQGHSWGGYQTAYLVTQTDMFACAESGAPVSNMTSAYGGIRWGSGLSRMFQYEKTQSRIGGTLWNAREKYIANSPLFFVDKINTPLLILHNDEDGAVPWYQGIEMFVAMRRLEKPAWLLNYNGDPHWVMGRENRLDFAKRMQQFFDHYLMDGPLPKWMAEGIPAVDKGKDFGFEEVEAEEGEEAEECEGTEEASETQSEATEPSSSTSSTYPQRTLNGIKSNTKRSRLRYNLS